MSSFWFSILILLFTSISAFADLTHVELQRLTKDAKACVFFITHGTKLTYTCDGNPRKKIGITNWLETQSFIYSELNDRFKLKTAYSKLSHYGAEDYQNYGGVIITATKLRYVPLQNAQSPDPLDWPVKD